MNLHEYDKLVTIREVGQHHNTEEACEQSTEKCGGVGGGKGVDQEEHA